MSQVKNIICLGIKIFVEEWHIKARIKTSATSQMSWASLVTRKKCIISIGILSSVQDILGFTKYKKC